MRARACAPRPDSPTKRCSSSSSTTHPRRASGSASRSGSDHPTSEFRSGVDHGVPDTGPADRPIRADTATDVSSVGSLVPRRQTSRADPRYPCGCSSILRPSALMLTTAFSSRSWCVPARAARPFDIVDSQLGVELAAHRTKPTRGEVARGVKERTSVPVRLVRELAQQLRHRGVEHRAVQRRLPLHVRPWTLPCPACGAGHALHVERLGTTTWLRGTIRVVTGECARTSTSTAVSRVRSGSCPSR